MKQFSSLVVIAGLLTVGAPGQARMVSTKAQCVAACSSAINDTCGWIYKQGKFTRCQSHLIRQCRRWGTETMCPAPPPTTTTTVPPPVVTTTTAPPLQTTTTTMLVVSPTTTSTTRPV